MPNKRLLQRLLIVNYCLLAEANRDTLFCNDKGEVMKDINRIRKLLNDSKR